MVLIFETLKSYWKTRPVDEDNFIFKLFYNFSFGICILAAVLVTAKEYIGKPINCSQSVQGIDKDTLEAHCWIHGSYHIKQDKKEIFDHTRCQKAFINGSDDDELDTVYYQWVSFMLVINAIIFLIPHLIWKSKEGGIIKAFCKEDVSRKSHLLAEGAGDEEDQLLSKYVDKAKRYSNYFQQLKKGQQLLPYFGFFAFCEVLNLVVLICNFSITNAFLNGNFKSYGSEAMRYRLASPSLQKQWINPMCDIFPTTVSCLFNQGGLTGGNDKDNAICILSQNIINEKIYFALWFWWMILFGIVGFWLVFRIVFVVATILVPSMKKQWFMRSLNKNSKLHSNERLNDFLNDCNVGDLFLLSQIGKNVDPFFFHHFVQNLLSESNSDPEGKNLLNRVVTDHENAHVSSESLLSEANSDPERKNMLNRVVADHENGDQRAEQYPLSEM